MSRFVAPLRKVLLVFAVAVPVVLAIGGGVWAGTRGDLIIAESTLVIAPGGLVGNDPGLNLATTDLLRNEAAVATLAALAEDESIQQATLRAIGLDEDAIGDVQFEIATPPRSMIMRVEVAAPTGEGAVAARDALVERIADDFQRNYAVLRIEIVQSRVGDEPSGGLPIWMGALAGLIAGAALAWLALSLRVYLSAHRE